MRAIDQATGAVLATRIERADRFWPRLRGLLGRARFEPGEGLLLVPCASIHTLGMRFPIDALFLDAGGTVLHAIRALAPWRLAPPIRGARMVLELPAGTLARCGTGAGSVVRFERPS